MLHRPLPRTEAQDFLAQHGRVPRVLLALALLGLAGISSVIVTLVAHG